MASLIMAQTSVLGALMGFLTCVCFEMAESTCCDLQPPPSLNKLRPPPKPHWLNLNFDLSCNGSVVIENLYDRTTGSVLVTLAPPPQHGNGGDGGGDVDSGNGDDDGDRPVYSGVTNDGGSDYLSSSGLENSTSMLFGGEPAASQDGSGSKMSAAQIVPLVIGLLLATGILAFAIVVYYKKRYIKYRVSPERSRADRCPEDGRSRHGKNRSAATMESLPSYRSAINADKQALVNSTVTSQVSLSSASCDTAPLTGPTASSLSNVPPVKEANLSEDRASLSSGIGMSQPDLQDSAEAEDVPDTRGPNSAGLLHRPISGGLGGLPQVEYNLAQPDIIKSTLNNNVDSQPAGLRFPRRALLPILTPLRSWREPKKSRVIDPDAKARSSSPRRSSSRQRPLSVSRDEVESDNVSPGDSNEHGDKSARKSKRERRKKKRHNFLKGKQKESVNFGLEDAGDSSEILANPYARLPAISSLGQEESCA